MLEDENVNVILFYFPQKHFAMTIKRDSDGNKKHKMLSTKKERENVLEAMILGRKIILVVLLGLKWKKHKMLSTKMERENVSESMISGRNRIILVFWGGA